MSVYIITNERPRTPFFFTFVAQLPKSLLDTRLFQVWIPFALDACTAALWVCLHVCSQKRISNLGTKNIAGGCTFCSFTGLPWFCYKVDTKSYFGRYDKLLLKVSVMIIKKGSIIYIKFSLYTYSRALLKFLKQFKKLKKWWISL